MVNINGSTVVVTGGQRGLGKAIVEELLARGAAKVYATARAPKPSQDPRVVSVPLDVTDPESVAALAIEGKYNLSSSTMRNALNVMIRENPVRDN
jgi:NAD(P)-dependent dehydrogenase (short-subunit alcohol dehydrogenase family)